MALREERILKMRHKYINFQNCYHSVCVPEFWRWCCTW